jgi:hypothetical protein
LELQVSDIFAPSIGFQPDEIQTGEPTRSARLKWVIVVDGELRAGQAVNAAACVASATAVSVAGLLGPDGKDGGGSVHPGLPWAGCSVLAASRDELAGIRARAAAAADVFLADMPAAAQRTRVYDDYLSQLAGAAPEQLSYVALSLVGPRRRIDKLAGKLPLLS